MFAKLIRLGRDAELRTTQNNKQVLNFAGAYDVGFGNDKKTQWIDCSLWGNRAQAVAQYMTKGAQVVIYADNLHIEEFKKNDGTTGNKLKCTVNNLQLAGGNNQGSAPQAAPQQQSYQQAPQQQAPQSAPSYSDPFEDDTPPF